MATRTKSTAEKNYTKPCDCPVCDIVDQFGISYSRSRHAKGDAVIPFLPPLFIDDDGNICEGEYLDPCDAIDAGFIRNNKVSGHLLLPKWILNCNPTIVTDANQFPKKANGDNKPVFRVFCLQNGDMVVPRDFVEPELFGDGTQAELRKRRDLKVDPDTCKAGVSVGFAAPEEFGDGDAAALVKRRDLKVDPDTCKAGVSVGFAAPPTLPANATKTNPVYVNPNCQLRTIERRKVCGAAVGTPGVDGEPNEPISGNDGDEFILDGLGTVTATYTNNSDCPMRLEFQSSSSTTIEIDPGSFIQVGHDIAGGFAGGTQFDAGGSQTPGSFNKSDVPECETFTVIHNNCICLQPGQSATYSATPMVRTKQDGSTGRVISHQLRSRVCWESL